MCVGEYVSMYNGVDLSRFIVGFGGLILLVELGNFVVFWE